jgi:hypothetical protein
MSQKTLPNVLIFKCFQPGANPTTVSYNASVVNIYNATSSLVHFENNNILSYILSTALALYIVVNSKIVHM